MEDIKKTGYGEIEFAMWKWGKKTDVARQKVKILKILLTGYICICYYI